MKNSRKNLYSQNYKELAQKLSTLKTSGEIKNSPKKYANWQKYFANT